MGDAREGGGPDRRREENSVRVTNLSDDVTEADLAVRISMFGFDVQYHDYSFQIQFTLPTITYSFRSSSDPLAMSPESILLSIVPLERAEGLRLSRLHTGGSISW